MNRYSDKSLELAALWQLVLQDDKESFNLIHKHLFEGLFYYAHKWLKNDDLASDAVQELFIKMWSKRHRINAINNVQIYFFTALRRLLLNQKRNNKSQGLSVVLGNSNIEFSPEEVIIRSEESQLNHSMLMEMLNNLPARQREIIYFYFFEKMAYKEIASIMKINYQSVLNLMQKALENLRKNPGLLFLFLFFLVMCDIK